MGNSSHVLVLLALGTVQLAGCIGVRSGSGSIAFSPDGKHICYLKQDQVVEEVVDGKIWSRSINLHWCTTTAPAAESAVHIDNVGAEYRGYIEILNEVRWSPKGSWIGVLTPNKLTIIAIESGKKLEIRDGAIWSFAWLSEGQVAYGTRRTIGNMQKRVICREDLDRQQQTEVIAFPGRPADGNPGRREHWSPSGRFVVLMEPDCHGQFQCVDISNGRSCPFGQTDAYDVGVSWAPDSSRVFCLSGKVGIGYDYEAMLLNPETGSTVACTAGFQKTFPGYAPSVMPLWTVDGKYVLVNALKVGGYLVRPDPWEAVPLGQMVAPNFTAPTRYSKIDPWLFALPTPGWVGVVPTGNDGDSPIKYAVDYSGKLVLPLLEDYPRAISPDGTMAATIGEDGHVKIRNLGKWWDSPNSGGASLNYQEKPI